MANSLKRDSAALLTILQRFPAFHSIKTWWLAYSGGVDSRVLLHWLSQLDLPVHAVYVDHGLQAASKQWAEHCHQTCAQLQLPFTVMSVDATPQHGESPEAAARRARYQALGSLVKAGDCLLTAQHADDQAETFLLQLMRGAGAAGLSAMPFAQTFHEGWLLRPLLEISRQEIITAARSENLAWVEDPSNSDERFDRNYLRQTIFPALIKRWPHTAQILYRAAQQQAENQALLEALAEQDLALQHLTVVLSVENLTQLDEPRQRNALRYWLEHNQVRMPSRAVMQQILSQLVHGREDAQACVHWDDVALYCYRKQLHLQKNSQHDASQVLSWDGRQALIMSSIEQTLIFEKTNNAGLSPDMIGKTLQVKFRQGGEKIKPAGQAHTHTLKNLFQQQGVPPWLRDRIPLLYLSDELIAVCGYWVADAYAVKSGEGLMPKIKEKEMKKENANTPL
ncbi:MAG: tRNA lysidine(34) synthetase TilS [Gammaproteobacteria bacterium]|nr:tRNA lysidine(34) synthetase TilS [Gammaproteobacteria bacterium]